MRYSRCKCGKIESIHSGYATQDCEGCSECKTTLSEYPSEHKELQPHDFSVEQYTPSGEKYLMCSKCLTRQK